ncbi:MAG TPA: hypothetical protein VGR62_20260 [Candidatus Binatia bacterium]|nr:hypothetical protein [Candidatus Binatia bacterium]
MTRFGTDRLRALLVLSATAAALLLLAAPADAQKARPARCQGGYYLIDGDPLVPGGTAPDALVIDRGAVSTLSGCPSTSAKVFKAKGKSGTDTLTVKWPACGSLAKATLKAQISADCSTVSGKFKAKGAKGRKITAHDGIPTGLRDSWGPTPPPGAVIVTPPEFIDASTQPGFRLITPNQADDDEAAAAAIDAENQATLDEFLAEHPDREEFVSIAVDPTDPYLQATEDGNYRLVVYDGDGNGQYVTTQGPRYQRAIRAETIRNFPTQENQLAVYRQLYAFAHEHLDPTLPSPDDVAGDSAEELSALNRGIAEQTEAAEQAAPLPGETLPASYPSRCSNEIGSGDGTDGAAYCRHTPDGLWNTATWPLKFFDTCVKVQANRGTCAAFATTAGRELRVAQKYERWMNLSEQHLYYMAKRTLQPDEYGDGLRSSALQGDLFSSRYEQPLEQDWDYNPSLMRTDDDKKKKYTSSCVDYAGAEQAFCSDTSHQGRVLCMQQGANLVCAVTAPPLGATRVRTTEAPAELWDAVDPINGLRNVIISLLNHAPLVIGFEVVESFDTPDSNGYVHLKFSKAKICREVAIDPAVPDVKGCEDKGDCQCPEGGHAVLAVGYIPESKLPEGLPESTGGFLIIKNSWGCVGDGGYYYLPAAWARTFIHSARPVGDVEVLGPLPDQPMDNFTFAYTPSPPSIRIVQPTFGETFVAGQGIPLSIEGADFQYDQWALLGPVVWTSDLQGDVGAGLATVTTLVEGRHRLTATYTGKLGVPATARVTVDVGPAPPDLPPTPFFTSYSDLTVGQCPGACGPGTDTCIVGFGYGSDPEDGLLTDGSHVRWYLQVGTAGVRKLGSTGASSGSQGKFVGCFRACGATFRFILEVEDSNGTKKESRREIDTPTA